MRWFYERSTAVVKFSNRQHTFLSAPPSILSETLTASVLKLLNSWQLMVHFPRSPL
jgi:hypothetical protein